MTEDIEEINRITAFLQQGEKNKQFVLNLISTFELSLTHFLNHTMDEEKKLVYDSLLL